MRNDVRARLKWIEMYEREGNATLVCRRCGISRPTLRKWVRRFKSSGLAGLTELSRRPKKSPRQKVFEAQSAWILALRCERNLGARRIQAELVRLHQVRLSLDTIHRVLKRAAVPLVVHKRRHQKTLHYSRPIPGERVQLDTMKIAPGVIQYTAVDDCTRYRVLAVYPRRTASNTLLFLEKLIEEMPFPIQRIQTDRGREFFATKVQEKFKDFSIKFRPIRPASPHLNGKVERSQKTDLGEFYATVDVSDPKLPDRLQEWQHHYNWDRLHGAHNGASPMDRFFELIDKIPSCIQVNRLISQKKSESASRFSE